MAMETIIRKTMLYKTGVEYGDYTMNHILGCSHGCKFPCYAFLLKRRFGIISSYEEWCKPRLVVNTLELLEKELPLLKVRIKSVHLCFSSDPFMYGYPDVEKMSLDAIELINKFAIKCVVLTKGVLPKALANFDKKNEYGISLITTDENYRMRMEPGAAPLTDRVSSLYALHKSGCKTWVSIEPYPTPNLISQDIFQVLNAIKFVDKIIFGRTNYSKEVSSYKKHKTFYNQCAQTVAAFCAQNNIKLHIKDGTVTE